MPPRKRSAAVAASSHYSSRVADQREAEELDEQPTSKRTITHTAPAASSSSSDEASMDDEMKSHTLSAASFAAATSAAAASSSTTLTRPPPAAAAAASSSSATAMEGAELVRTRHLIAPTKIRRGRRRMCLLVGLADIELQSVMHFLSRKDLLVFGRCSRRLRSNADTPFAWKHHLPYMLKIGGPDPPEFDGGRLARSLLRHLPVCVEANFWSEDKAEATLTSILSIAQIQVLDMHGEKCTAEATLIKLVDHPTALKKVRSLSLGDASQQKVLSTVFSQAAEAGKLPALTALEFDVDFGAWSTCLLRFKQLTSLQISFAPINESVKLCTFGMCIDVCRV
jgi:hypothetical protein